MCGPPPEPVSFRVLVAEPAQDVAHRRELQEAFASNEETGPLELSTGDSTRLDRGRPAAAEPPEGDRPARGGHQDGALEVLEPEPRRSRETGGPLAGVGVVHLDGVRGAHGEPLAGERRGPRRYGEVPEEAAGGGEQ